MVQLICLEKKNLNTWQCPQQETMDLAGGKRPMKLEGIVEEIPLHKRWKSSSSQTTYEMGLDSNEFPVPPSEYNLLDDPPLGLRLKKSPSFLELIQIRISQANINNCALPIENLQVGNKKNVKARVGTSGPIDKLKASNFPAVLLRIGQWEYVSKHEGDLVGKCYFAKHKLVWEVLDGGLKSKIEIQWADIVGLRANCPDNGPGTLTIVLGKQPLFFRETDPQPRKHTLWQATSDFTGGEASTYRQHFLQCPQGVLNKHYEKLIQCDTRLNFLSQQLDPVSDFPFAQKASVKDPDVLSNNGNMGTLDSVHGDFIKECRYVENSGQVGSNAIRQVKTPGPHQTMSIPDVVNHIGRCITENASGLVNQSHMRQILLNDNQLTTAPDGNDYSNPDDVGNNYVNGWHDIGNGYFNPYCYPSAENENVTSREDSFTDLLHQLPRVASLPRLFVDTSQDGESMDFI